MVYVLSCERRFHGLEKLSERFRAGLDIEIRRKSVKNRCEIRCFFNLYSIIPFPFSLSLIY